MGLARQTVVLGAHRLCWSFLNQMLHIIMDIHSKWLDVHIQWNLPLSGSLLSDTSFIRTPPLSGHFIVPTAQISFVACSLLTIMKFELDESTRRVPKGCCLPVRWPVYSTYLNYQVITHFLQPRGGTIYILNISVTIQKLRDTFVTLDLPETYNVCPFKQTTILLTASLNTQF